uniref:putative mediator of RNA polymerase II transcription subunit 26 isoform X2 n=1 Tax=Scatophagus argus TaxID=75038 RepID=UPI001ED81434|nr:putative mediator of RNA polymerase II transcription subunit 26 isoform X2 [Scatophagus argus]
MNAALQPTPQQESLDNLIGSMMGPTWRYASFLFVFVFLITVKSAKQDCLDYFSLKYMEKYLRNTTNISLVQPENPKDTIECSLERACIQREDLHHVLSHCFHRESLNATKKCEGNTSGSLHLYPFMCLVAEVSGHTPEVCAYNTACELYSEITSSVYTTTTRATTLSPTSLSERSTTSLPERSTTSLPERSTTSLPERSTTSLPERSTTLLSERSTASLSPPTTTTTATTLSPRTTLPERSTTTVIPGTDSESDGHTLDKMQEHDNNDAASKELTTLKRLLMLSGFLNIAVPLTVYMYMRNKRRWDCGHSSEHCLSIGTFTQAQCTEMKSQTPSTRVGGVESSRLMQHPECDSITTNSDGKSDCCATENEMPH